MSTAEKLYYEPGFYGPASYNVGQWRIR